MHNKKVLKALSKIGLDVDPPRKWGNEYIKWAIKSINWERNWPDRSQPSEYKTFNRCHHGDVYGRGYSY